MLQGIGAEVEAEVRTACHEDNWDSVNISAEIPGRPEPDKFHVSCNADNATGKKDGIEYDPAPTARTWTAATGLRQRIGPKPR